MHGGRTGQINGRFVAVVAWVQHDDFIARTHHRMDGIEDRLGGTAGDGDLGIHIGPPAIATRSFIGNRLAQRRDAGHHRILVVAGVHRTGQCIHQTRGYREIRKALAQIDRAMLCRQLRHHGKNRGADLRQFGV